MFVFQGCIFPVYMFGNKATSGHMVPRPGDLNILNIGFQGFGLDSGPNPLTLFFFHEDCLAARRYGKTWQNKVFLNSLNAMIGPQSLVTGRQRQSSIKKDTKHSRVFLSTELQAKYVNLFDTMVSQKQGYTFFGRFFWGSSPQTNRTKTELREVQGKWCHLQQNLHLQRQN